jgi:hypothetical protein
MTIEPDDTFTRRGTPALHEPDGSLRVTADTGTQTVLNPTAAAIWELLDGETTVDEVVVAATSLFAGPAADIRQDILTTLGTMREQRLLA